MTTLPTVPLGHTGLNVSPIGLGTVKLGRNTKVKYPGAFDLPTDSEVERLLETALELGVTLIDTAPAYGTSELRLAPFLSRNRDAVVLCSKCGETYTDGVSTYDFSGDGVTRSVENSLRRLGTDRLDILLLHSGGRDVEILDRDDTRDALQRLKADGKVLAIGISAKTDAGLRAAAERELDVVMTGFSSADPGRAGALTDAHSAGLGVLAIKGLAQGHLSEMTAADAVGYVLGQPFVDSLVVGTLNTDHLRELVSAVPGA